MNAPEEPLMEPIQDDRLLRRYVSDYVPTGAAQHEAFAALDRLVAERKGKQFELDHMFRHHEQFHPGPCMSPEYNEAQVNKRVILETRKMEEAWLAERDRLVAERDRLIQENERYRWLLNELGVSVEAENAERRAVLSKNTEEP